MIITKNYDSEFCGSIPLNLINFIQPYGILLVLDKSTLKVIQASENVGEYFSDSIDGILNKPISDLCSTEGLADLIKVVKEEKSNKRICNDLLINFKGKEVLFDVIVHPHEKYILLELEKAGTEQKEAYSHLRIVHDFSLALKNLPTLNETLQVAARDIKHITGFDKVMIYRFDSNWNGITVAEEKEEDMDAYLHLRFPASDVPKQARELYKNSPYRMIPDCNGVPVKLIPLINPATNAFIDLTSCNLRGVASVHTEYLKNMKVRASFSIAIVLDDKLWGLIACHHKTPKHLCLQERTLLEVICEIVSMHISSKEKQSKLINTSALREIQARMMERMYGREECISALLDGDNNIMHLFNLSGVALMLDGELSMRGQTPSRVQIREIINWLQNGNVTSNYFTHSLPDVYVEGKEYSDIASGLMALPLSYREGSYILGFRPEVIQTIQWGGDPKNAIQMEADGKTYHPRNSFSIYKEQVKDNSMEWKQEEMEIAEDLRVSFLERIGVGK